MVVKFKGNSLRVEVARLVLHFSQNLFNIKMSVLKVATCMSEKFVKLLNVNLWRKLQIIVSHFSKISERQLVIRIVRFL